MVQKVLLKLRADRFAHNAGVRNPANHKDDGSAMKLPRFLNFKECALCVLTLVIVAGAPILVSAIMLVRG